MNARTTTRTPVCPDVKAYFRSRIEHHVHGMLARSTATLPAGVRVSGDVTDPVIVVTDADGNEFRFTGGRYAARKAHGCYAPLMPRPAR